MTRPAHVAERRAGADGARTQRRTLTPVAPFDVGAVRARLAAWDAGATDLELDVAGAPDRAVRLALAVPSGAAVATIAPETDGTLSLRLDRDDGAPPTPADAEAAAATITRAWGLADDHGPLDEAARHDPPFAEVAERLRGARVLRHLSPDEALAWTLVRQRTPHRFARTSLERLRDALGPTAEAFGRRWHAFPSATTLAADASRPALLAATNNVRKVDRLHAASAMLADLDPDWLRGGPLDDVKRALARGHGVGTWTVDYVVLLGLGRLEHVPWSDTGLAQAVADVYAGGLTLDRATLRRLAEPYRPLGGVWAHWLKRARHGWRGY